MTLQTLLPECSVCHKIRASAKPVRPEKNVYDIDDLTPSGELKVFQPPYPIGCRQCGRGNGITVSGIIEELDEIRNVPEPNLILTKADVGEICFQCKSSFSEDEEDEHVLMRTDTEDFFHIGCANFILTKADVGEICFQCKSSFSKDDLVLRTIETWFGGKKYKKEFFHVGCANPFSSDKSINPVRHAGFRCSLDERTTAKLTLTLWKKDTERFRVGDTIKVTNGYAYPYGHDKFPHISAGYFGKVNLACVQRCGTEIYFDKSRKTDKGKWIPLEVDTKEPHNCPNNPYNQGGEVD